VIGAVTMISCNHKFTRILILPEPSNQLVSAFSHLVDKKNIGSFGHFPQDCKMHKNDLLILAEKLKKLIVHMNFLTINYIAFDAVSIKSERLLLILSTNFTFLVSNFVLLCQIDVLRCKFWFHTLKSSGIIC